MERWNYRQSGTGTGHINDVPRSARPWSLRLRRTVTVDIRFHGLNEYDYGARWYDPILARFTTVDPLCEKYYSISPYAYCANNPVNAVDPDGKTIYVVFHQGGKTYNYIFDGTIGKIPNNPFVLDFIEAYNYNRKNGGGDNMYKAATDPKLKIFVKDATKYQNIKKRTTEYDWGGENLIIRWESRKGLLTTEGGHQSPATRLDMNLPTHQRQST